jgi:hypothetical protein
MTLVNYPLILVCVGALIFRLMLLQFVQHPGIGDPNHYYNIGLRMLDGHGLTIDYIWQFNDPPDGIEHDDDYWMPLTGVIAALSMQIFGRGVHQSLMLFIIMGSSLPIIAYWASKGFGCEEAGCLFAAGAVAFLPEFALNSVRTDTTIPNTILLCATILLFLDGLKTGRVLSYIVSGICSGLAYLVRSDSSLLLPIMSITITLCIWKKYPIVHWSRIRYAIVIPFIMVLIIFPWGLRNLQLNGTLTTPKLEYMFYLTNYLDHYVYSTELSLQTLLSLQTPVQLISKRIFEMAASVKLMYTTLDQFLAVAVAGGALLLLRDRKHEKSFVLVPVILLLIGFFCFYSILVPFKSQGGSFKKAYISLIPLLLPLGAYAVEYVVKSRKARNGVMLLTLFFIGMNGLEYVRADSNTTNSYLNMMKQVVAKAQSLPDTNNDGIIILMAQDPFMLSFLDTQSVMIPMENLDVILEVARRYKIDYIMMPPARPALDSIYFGTKSDSRLIHEADVNGTQIQFFKINNTNTDLQQ